MSIAVERHHDRERALPAAANVRRRRSPLTRMLGALALLVALAPLTASASPRMEPSEIAPPASHDFVPPRTVYVPETGQTVDGLFLDLWRGGGGYWAFGNPITPEFTLENGHVVQYYEYARFEYWPEGDEYGNYVRLGHVGEELRPLVVPRRALPSVGEIVAKEAGAANARQTGGSAVSQPLSAAVELALLASAWMPLPETRVQEDSETYRYVPETGHSVRLGFKAFWEATGEAGYLGNPLTEEYILAGTTYQVFERGQLAWVPGIEPYMVQVGAVLAERYDLATAPVAQGDIPTYSEDLFIPPPHPEPVRPALDPTGERWIEVNLSSQYMIAWQGNSVAIESYISTGKYGFETPAGTYFVLSKLDSQDMEGVIGGEYYNVPGVPWVMYFTDWGHAIHGTYWHSNFGATMSHGCVNLPMDVAAFVYDWMPIGARVEIHW